MATLTEEKYRELKKAVDFARSESNRAQGGLDTLTTRLKNEFDFNDLESAKEGLKALEKKAKKAEEAFEEALETYNKNWKKVDE
jgi:hypothetical protein